MRLVSRKTKMMPACIIQRIQGKKPVHLLHIGKTGGSAVKHTLKQYPPNNRYAVHLHKHGVKLSDIPKGNMVIFVVRDPVSRFISGFYSRHRC